MGHTTRRSRENSGLVPQGRNNLCGTSVPGRLRANGVSPVRDGTSRSRRNLSCFKTYELISEWKFHGTFCTVPNGTYMLSFHFPALTCRATNYSVPAGLTFVSGMNLLKPLSRLEHTIRIIYGTAEAAAPLRTGITGKCCTHHSCFAADKTAGLASP